MRCGGGCLACIRDIPQIVYNQLTPDNPPDTSWLADHFARQEFLLRCTNHTRHFNVLPTIDAVNCAADIVGPKLITSDLMPPIRIILSLLFPFTLAISL